MKALFFFFFKHNADELCVSAVIAHMPPPPPPPPPWGCVTLGPALYSSLCDSRVNGPWTESTQFTPSSLPADDVWIKSPLGSYTGYIVAVALCQRAHTPGGTRSELLSRDCRRCGEGKTFFKAPYLANNFKFLKTSHVIINEKAY